MSDATPNNPQNSSQSQSQPRSQGVAAASVSADDTRSCANCRAFVCTKGEGPDGAYPEFCPTTHADAQAFNEATAAYQDGSETARIFQAAAEIEGLYYGQLTRVEEIMVFARKIGAQKIGIAACKGLIDETQTFAKILRAKGFTDVCEVACKVGGIDKELVGIPDEVKIHPGCVEPTCNPLMQAHILNERGTDLNVIVGLCVGHDTLFIKNSEAPVTYLVVKDRVLAHNPAGALYTKGSYYKRLMDPNLPEPRPKA